MFSKFYFLSTVADDIPNPLSDIDECVQSPENCMFGKCTNFEGSFTCECPEGFQLSASGRRCLGECKWMKRETVMLLHASASRDKVGKLSAER